MPSRRVAVLILPLALLAVVLSGCDRNAGLDSLWPEAVSERSVPRPPGPPRWPLTGMDAPSAKAIAQRIVSVKIENSPQARPQFNLDKADIVYETVTEGGITRFNALFHSNSPRAVAPTRSARASDFSIVPQYRALFAHVGGDSDVRAQLKNTKKFDDMDQFFNPAAYWRGKDRSAPHNMYVDIVKLRDLAIRNRGYDASATVRPFAFDRTSLIETVTVTQIGIPFSDANKVSWKYNKSTGRYARSINGRAHTDKASKKQYTARNVVVLWAVIRPWKNRDKTGSPVYNIILTGSGPASVFRGGRRYDGTWTATDKAPPTFKAKDGTVIRLSPGNSWFQVIGKTQDITSK